MTVEKILTTLELCAKGLCEHCEYKNWKEMCKEELNVDIATLIKNQHTIIEQLYRVIDDKNQDIKRLEDDQAYLIDLRFKEASQVRIKTIKECVDKLKERSCFYDLDNYHSFRAVDVDDVDNVAKELIGD